MENITENNALIAEFMGFFKARVSRGFAWDNNKITKPITLHGDLVGTRNNGRFHESWDWLMPVVEKIEKSPSVHNFHIERDTAEIIFKSRSMEYPCIDVGGKTKIEAAYRAVIKFIKWYNEVLKADKND